MIIRATVELGPDQTISNTPSEIATEILAACEGDPAADFCSVQVMSSPQPGTAGTPPPSSGMPGPAEAVQLPAESPEPE